MASFIVFTRSSEGNINNVLESSKLCLFWYSCHRSIFCAKSLWGPQMKLLWRWSSWSSSWIKTNPSYIVWINSLEDKAQEMLLSPWTNLVVSQRSKCTFSSFLLHITASSLFSSSCVQSWFHQSLCPCHYCWVTVDWASDWSRLQWIQHSHCLRMGQTDSLAV